MNRRLITLLLLLGFCAPVQADVWRWVDPLGNTHFVDTFKSIYTWVDDLGKVHFSDKPEHSNAVAVQLVWHSKGSLEDIDAKGKAGKKSDAGSQQKFADSAYCLRVEEILETYLKAPILLRTTDTGESEALTDKEAAAAIAEVRGIQQEYCR